MFLVKGVHKIKKTNLLIIFFLLTFSTISCSHLQKCNNLTEVDILIENGIIVTVDSTGTVLENGAIAIKDKKIIAIGSNDLLKNKFIAAEVIDAKDKIVMPGLINTHTHAAMTIFRGYADDMPLNEWLENYIWPAEAKYINSETVRQGTLLAIIEMIHSGTTTFNDMYFFEDEAAQASKDIGMRAVVGEGLILFPTPNKKNPDDGLAYTEYLINKWKNDPLINVAVAPHAPYTCSPELLKKAKALSDKYNVPLHIHLSETKKEFNDIKNQYGITPVAYLNTLGLLDNNLIAAHSVHLTEEDIALLSEKKAGVAHNPKSNMKLASGTAPVVSLLNKSVKIGLGTDGAASNNDLSLFEEMKTASLIHKVINENTTVLNAQSVVRMATIEGAKVLKLDKQIGSLELGKLADIIIINTAKPHMVPMYNPYSHIVYAANSSDVEAVIINGKLIMQNQKLIGINEEKIMQDVRLIAEKIKKENKKL